MTSDSGRDHGKSTSIMVIKFKHDLKRTSSNYPIVQFCQWVSGLDDAALGWSLRRFRERILRVASRVICHGRRLTFVIAQSAADDWQKLWRKLNRLRWASG